MEDQAIQGGNPQPEVREQPAWKKVLYNIEDIFCIAALVLMALIPIMESVARLFSTGILASSGFLVHMLLFTGLLGGMICTRKESHLAISLVHYIPEGSIKANLKVFCNLISAFVAIIIAWSSISFIKIALVDGRMIGFIPDRVFALIIPIAFGVIAVRFARRTTLTGWKIVFPILSLVLGTVASFPVIAKIIWGFDMPDNIFSICDQFITVALYAKVPLIVLLLLAALGGTPLFVIIGGFSLLLLQASGGEMDSVADSIYSGLINRNIIAIPLFTLVGFFLSESKAGERLVNTFRCFFSWLPGGIIIVSVIICAFFTSFTGASGVTILALGGILYAILSDHLKYPAKFSVGLLTSVGSIGLLFPPSLPLILVGTVMQVNIFHMFLGGMIPGLILVVAMVVFGVIISIKIKIPVEKFEGRKALSCLKASALEILLPVFLIAGYFSGILSLVELGAAAVLYIFIVEVIIYRDIKFSDLKKVFDKAIPIIGGILSILALAKALSYYIVDTQVPANMAVWMYSAVTSKYVFLLLLNGVLLLIGCFLDMFSAILILLPLIVPLGEIYGINPVHLGIIFLVNLEVGYITPPVGLNLFLASYRFQKPFVEICKFIAPFLLVRLIVVLLVTYLPWLSTWLVSVFTGAQ
ncbi:MAG: TRAP transporter large permease subunit [Treponema sp.]|nr:TRAP transporter large permease subunit [Treponema sp.]